MASVRLNQPSGQKLEKGVKERTMAFVVNIFLAFYRCLVWAGLYCTGPGDQSSPVTGRHIHIRIFFPAFIY